MDDVRRAKAIGGELRSAGNHLKNAGRAAAGKEVQRADSGEEGRFQSAVLAPVRTTHKLLSHMNNTALAAIGNVERLEQAAAEGREKRAEKKPSIRQALAEKQAEAAARPASAPEKEKKAHEAAL